MGKIVVDLDEELHRVFRVICALDGVSQVSRLAVMVKEYVDREQWKLRDLELEIRSLVEEPGDIE